MIERILFSDEANAEIADQMNRLTFLLDTGGDNVKFIEGDSTQALYSMTTFKKEEKDCPIDIMDKLLNCASTDITLPFLFKEIRIADTTKFKKLVDVHDVCRLNKSVDAKHVVDTLQFADIGGPRTESKNTCTVGQLIVYKLLLEDVKYGLVNIPWTGKIIESILSDLSRDVISGKITIQEFKHMLNKYESFSLRMGAFINPSVDSDLLVLTPEILKRKEELIQENAEAIKNDDLVVTSKIEKELIDMVKKEFEDNPSAEMYVSGGGGSFNNQFKTMAIMSGALPQDASFDKFKVSTRSLNEGLKKSELMYAMNTAIVGAYSRGKAPEEGGAMANESGRIFQNIFLDKFGSDCKSQEYVEILIKNVNSYIGRTVLDGGKLVKITDENKKKYNGVKIKMRSVLTCKSKDVCSVCVGEQLYNVYGIYDKKLNYGLKLNKQQHELVQKRLKLSHDTSIKFVDFDFGNYKESKKKLR